MLDTFNVRTSFIPPTALRIMRAFKREDRNPLAMRSVGSGGESLGADMLIWGRKALGTTINEFYGQTECNLVVSNCNVLFEAKNNSMGRVVPGKSVQS